MGRPTGIDIEGEAAGRVPTPEWRQKYFRSEVDKLWTPGNSINLSIGQGDLEATPLQLAVTYAAIANGGRVVTPHLGLRIVDAAREGPYPSLAPESRVLREVVDVDTVVEVTLGGVRHHRSR